MKNLWISILVVGMTMGTSWAVRGQFGHEQGAAWAAAIAALSLVLVSLNRGWYRKVFTITLASAIGWGMGGMISYGMIVGFGRSTSYPNAYYGLLMLFVIGALYGLTGGGLTALTLEGSREKRVKWAGLITEMVAGGLLAYGFLIMQIGFKMTPPRSEAWAFCLGAGLAMVWHMARNGYSASLRVALIAALGAGFGFAFGNFLQTLGTAWQIKFNMWNVMEYSIGFFGGASMAYAIFTTDWPKETEENKPWENRTAFLLVFAFVPLILYRESLTYPILLNRLSFLDNVADASLISTIISAVLFLALAVWGWFQIPRLENLARQKEVMLLFLFYFGIYIFISYMVYGLFGGKTQLNHHLYVANLLVVVYLLKQKFDPFQNAVSKSLNLKKLAWITVLLIVVVALLALISINAHDGIQGARDRFEL